ncbi:MAG: hypothetical protein EFT35_02835 [Methanophagales archaeon ANME-1-THS]|nr:MAG: hypothetical protein EFT35_02835 [Methanophagales archaeon ANME-1-THS]
MKLVKLQDEWGYYPSSIFGYTILFYSLNMLDFIITRLALEHCESVVELNPLYHHPFFALLKTFVPVYLLALYFSLYFVSRSEEERGVIGRYGLGAIMMVVFLYEFICLNNLMLIYIAQ